MHNGFVLLLLAALFTGAILVGGNIATDSSPGPDTTPRAHDSSAVNKPTARRTPAPAESGIPSIGRVQVLNACGAGNAASLVADHLRGNGFDVKNVDNAPTWNYPYTIVVSRTRDMGNARKVARALKTENIILLRTGDDQYDVAVFVGPDYRKRIQ